MLGDIVGIRGYLEIWGLRGNLKEIGEIWVDMGMHGLI